MRGSINVSASLTINSPIKWLHHIGNHPECPFVASGKHTSPTGQWQTALKCLYIQYSG